MTKPALAMTAGLLLFGCFLTADNGITVSSPVSGSSYALNTGRTIAWNAPGVSGDVRIILFRNDDRVGIIKSAVSASSRVIGWEVGVLEEGGPVIAGSGYKVRVRGVGTEYWGESASFTIRNPSPRFVITDPNGGESLAIGTYGDIHYRVYDLPPELSFYFDLYRGGTAPANLLGRITPSPHQLGYARDDQNDTRFVSSWRFGSYASRQADPGGNVYYVRVVTEDNRVFDFSDRPFSLVAAAPPEPEEPAANAGSITVSSPLAPLTLTHDFSLGWNARNIAGKLVINVLREAGGTWTIATGVDPGSAYGRFTWIVGRLPNPASPFPGLGGQRFCFQISGRGTDGRPVSATGRWFEILRPAMTVSEPHNGQRVGRGSAQTIRWSAPDLRGNLHIEAHYRSVNDGGLITLYQRLFENASNNGSHEWRVWPRPRAGRADVDPPPSGNGIRWRIRLISERCPWLFVDSEEFILE